MFFNPRLYPFQGFRLGVGELPFPCSFAFHKRTYGMEHTSRQSRDFTLDTALSEYYVKTMRRWSQKNTPQAHTRMGELRAAKLHHQKQDLVAALKTKTGRADWWARAQADGLTYESSEYDKIAWLQRQLAV